MSQVNNRKSTTLNRKVTNTFFASTFAQFLWITALFLVSGLLKIKHQARQKTVFSGLALTVNGKNSGCMNFRRDNVLAVKPVSYELRG